MKIEKKNAFFDRFIEPYLLYLIILLSVAFKLMIFLKIPDLWWDSASYIGFGKYFFSLGQIGFLDIVRPVILPFILGFIWRIGLNPVMFGVLLQVVASSISVYLVYRITQSLFNNKKISLIAAFLLAIDPIIFNNVQHQLTETLGMMFALYAVFFFLNYLDSPNLKKYLVYSAIFCGVSFLTRFTFAIIGLTLFIILVLKKKANLKTKIKSGLIFSVTGLLTITPYLLLNILMYKNPLFPLLRGVYEIGLAGQMIGYSSFFYLIEIPKLSLFLVLASLGVLFLLFELKDEKKRTILLLLLLGVIYHSFFVAVKDLRYSILFLPFLIIIASYAAQKLISYNKILILLVFGLLLFSTYISLQNDIIYLKYTQTEAQNFLENNYYNYFDKKEFYGATVLSTNPYPAALSDVRLHSFFIPNVVILKDFEKTNQTFYVMFSDIDNSCDINMSLCKKKEVEEGDAAAYLFNHYEKIYNTSVIGADYYIFQYEPSK